MQRSTWTKLSDAQLLEQCEVDTYRASGPGGQKRNKTSSAVRIRHLPSGTIVIAEESRSQHENRRRALGRLRQALYLKIREQPPCEGWTAELLARRPDLLAARAADGRLGVQRKDPRYWAAAALALDVLQSIEARMADAAKLLGTSTANLVDFLAKDAKVWAEV